MTADEKKIKADNWKVTQDLKATAVLAVNELSKHLEKIGDSKRMFIANNALHALWRIE